MSFIGGYPLYTSTSTTAHQLQSTCSAATSGVGQLPVGVPHHPITCTSKLYYEEDGTFACEHGAVPPGDPRTQSCLIHSLAILIVEEAFSYTGMKSLPFDRYED